MPLHGPLRTDIVKYRKRNTISIYGSMPGLDTARYRPGLGEHPQYRVSWPDAALVQYDPWSPHYELGSPDYQQVDPWFEGMHVPRTPMIRWRRTLQPVGSARSDDEFASDELSEQWVEELRVDDVFSDGLDPHGPTDATEVAEEVLAPAPDAFTETRVMSVDDLDQLANRLVGELGGTNPTSMMGDLASQLEAGWAPMSEHGDPLAPMRQMYDDQLEMMLNPYAAPPGVMPGPGMMPPGLGPMGPSPSPSM